MVLAGAQQGAADAEKDANDERAKCAFGRRVKGQEAAIVARFCSSGTLYLLRRPPRALPPPCVPEREPADPINFTS